MIKEQWEQVVQNQEVRQNLSRLRQGLKEKGSRSILENAMEGNESLLPELLGSADAKTRKNAALLMGDIGRKEYLKPLYEAYEREGQRFVKSAYLSAISNFDYREYLDGFKERLELLRVSEVTAENEKHLMEEMRELSSLIVCMEGAPSHRFTGWDETYDVVLLTNRNFPELTKAELERLEPHAVTRVFNAGVMARVRNLRWAGKIRTCQDVLFMVRGMKTCPMEPVRAAEVIVKSGLMQFLAAGHEGKAPFYFRIEMKSKKELGEKSAFVKKMSGHIEKLSDRKLINSTTDYEVELRLIENKEGSCNLLVKLFTIKDERFSYRREVIPASIRPGNAALCVALAKDYMKEGAQVLDPFCGVGTMLIERHKAVRAGTMYGLDIQEDAVLKARKNTEAAGLIIHYINRDFFRFEHEYPFDEVITDMPFQLGRISQDEVEALYARFFSTVPSCLRSGAVMILYSHDRELVKSFAPKHRFTVDEEFEISKKEGTYVFVLKWQK